MTMASLWLFDMLMPVGILALVSGMAWIESHLVDGPEEVS